MKKIPGEIKPYELLVTNVDFLEAYNKATPEGFPSVSLPLLQKFKDEHPTLFKRSGLWSLDLHRKRLIDWLPRNALA
jgi:hypothetical protein